MAGFYPELKAREAHILKTLKEEEARFLQTLDQGTEILNNELKKLAAKNSKNLPGEVVFKLYDTFGFPVDLTEVMSAEKGIAVDHKAFQAEMDKARTRSQASWKGKALETSEAHLISWSQETAKAHQVTQFTGYETLQSTSKVLSLSNGEKVVPLLTEGQSGIVILDKTPMYAEGGGQTGDLGELKTLAASGLVSNTMKKNDVHLHFVEIKSGEIKIGDVVTSSVDKVHRRNTAAHHSATHLLHSALRLTLGTHVTQAGSQVESNRLRFDFTHHQPLSPQEILKIETLVNEEIAKAIDVQTQSMKPDDAIKAGALALFGEKYGDAVRVLTMGDFSVELCGGTHVKNTAQIRMFKITAESGVSSGVRRIEAVVADTAVEYAQKSIQQLDGVLHTLNQPKSFNFVQQSNEASLAEQILLLKQEISNREKAIKKLKGSSVSVSDIVKTQQKLKKATLVAAQIDIEDRDLLAQISDQIRDHLKSGVIVLLGKGSGTHPLLVTVTKDLTGIVKAGEILREIAGTMGGKGGGRPDFAQGAVPDGTAWSKAHIQLQDLLS